MNYRTEETSRRQMLLKNWNDGSHWPATNAQQ